MARRDISIELRCVFLSLFFPRLLLFLICFTDQVIFMLNEIDAETPIGTAW